MMPRLHANAVPSFFKLSLLGGLVMYGACGGSANAAGFASQTQSGSGLANAYAGGAAVSEDASVVWYNPAAMSRLQGTNFALAGYAINNNRNWEDKGSRAPTGQTLGATTDISPTAYVPNLFASHQLSERLHLGFAFNTPFGLKTEYNQDWMGRYQGVGSTIETHNLNAAISFKLNNQLSLGLGVNWQQIDAKLTSMTNYAAIAGAAAGAAGINSLNFRESLTTVEGSDASWGYNAGIHYAFNNKAAVGLHYRSAIHFHLTGKATSEMATSSGLGAGSTAINNAIASRARGGNVTADITVPASLSLSGVVPLNDNLELLGDIMWTQWSTVPKLEFNRVEGGILSTTQYNWRDTYRYSIGANYKLSDKLKLKTGVAYDESPIPAQYRTARLPDNDRIWLSAGFQYALNPKTKLDFGYTYVMVKNADLNGRREDNDPTGAGSGTLTGTFKQHVHILGVQLSYRF